MTVVAWRHNATANTDRDTRTQGFGVRELRPTSRHTDASKADEEEGCKKAEAEQGQGLAFSLSAPLAFRSLSLLALSGEAIPCQATARNLSAHDSKALCIGHLAPVVPKALLVK